MHSGNPRITVSWTGLVGHRLATHWPVKLIGASLWAAAFFWLYFWVVRNPVDGAFVWAIPATALDHRIVASDLAAIPYASLALYVALAIGLAKSSAELLAYAEGATFLGLLGLICYWLFPTTVQSASIAQGLHPALALLRSQDGAANAFPSLHAAFAVLSAAVIRIQLRVSGAPCAVRVLNMAWAACIVYSVLATRQQVLIDAVAGGAAGLLAFWIVADAQCMKVARHRARLLAGVFARRPPARRTGAQSTGNVVQTRAGTRFGDLPPQRTHRVVHRKAEQVCQPDDTTDLAT